MKYNRSLNHGDRELVLASTEKDLWRLSPDLNTCYVAAPEGNLIEIGSWNKPYEKKIYKLINYGCFSIEKF